MTTNNETVTIAVKKVFSADPQGHDDDADWMDRYLFEEYFALTIDDFAQDEQDEQEEPEPFTFTYGLVTVPADSDQARWAVRNSLYLHPGAPPPIWFEREENLFRGAAEAVDHMLETADDDGPLTLPQIAGKLDDFLTLCAQAVADDEGTHQDFTALHCAAIAIGRLAAIRHLVTPNEGPIQSAGITGILSAADHDHQEDDQP